MALRPGHLGIDFDNTIVCYDGVFHRVALEQGLIPPGVERNKVAVRDWLRRVGKEDAWTQMQGYVYGARMGDAEMYPGVREFLAAARNAGLPMSIVSHKTRHPFLGERYDLHAAATAWVDEFLRDDAGPFVAADRIYFETTKDAKWSRIAATGATHFIDDLPEILLADAFPAGVQRILFDPDAHHGSIGADVRSLQSWSELQIWFDAC